MASTTFFDGTPQHDGRDHNTHPLRNVDATTGTHELADISAEDSMQFALAFWAVSAVELDLFTELAAARRRIEVRAPASCRRLP
jgi:hypothetical protein